MLSTAAILRPLSTVRPTVRSNRMLSRTIHGCPVVQRQHDAPNPVSHGVENYFIDGDDTPLPNSFIYKVDATSDAAESAYEPPSGPWSRAGAETKEYQTVSRDEPCDVSNGTDLRLRYGGKKGYMEDQSSEASKPGEGPEGTERWGRKPEGRA